MTVCLLLAAGSSSRMGQPKMMLIFNGKPLLQHLINEVKQFQNTCMLVVTGCHHTLLKEILQPQQIPFVQNEQWEEGMGTSIQKGVTHIQQHFSNADQVIIMVCDQPFISSTLLQQMILEKETTGKGIVACIYNGTAGTPVLFDKKYFNQLVTLQGQHGAKKIIQLFADDVAAVDFPAGGTDIDTPDDYAKLTGAI